MAELAGRRMTAEIEATSLCSSSGRALVAHPEKGLLSYQMGLPVIVPYWRSFDHLLAFASDASDPHLAPWRQYWKRVGTSGRTGIWHETYLVRAGEYETVYGNMPPFGLGKAGRLVPVAEAKGARDRFRAAARGSAGGA